MIAPREDLVAPGTAEGGIRVADEAIAPGRFDFAVAQR